MICISSLISLPSQAGRRALLGSLAAVALWIGVPALVSAEPAGPRTVTVFAAASTTDALEDVARAYRNEKQGALRLVFAGSSTLAQQIARGAPADLYLSANPQWMDWLEAKGQLVPGSRVDLLGNRLALVVPADDPLSVELTPEIDLTDLLGDKRLAMADPSHVPAGLYGRAALEWLDQWRVLEPRCALTGDVRAALTLVERKEVAAGIVYATDAAITRRVRIAGLFPPESHPPIRFPLAAIAGRDRPAVRAAAAFLHGPRAWAIFEAHGFTVLEPAAGS